VQEDNAIYLKNHSDFCQLMSEIKDTHINMMPLHNTHTGCLERISAGSSRKEMMVQIGTYKTSERYWTDNPDVKGRWGIVCRGKGKCEY
jgi:hypothetical protein